MVLRETRRRTRGLWILCKASSSWTLLDQNWRDLARGLVTCTCAPFSVAFGCGKPSEGHAILLISRASRKAAASCRRHASHCRRSMFGRSNYGEKWLVRAEPMRQRRGLCSQDSSRMGR